MNKQELHNRQKRLKNYLDKIYPDIYDTQSTALEGLESSEAEYGQLNAGLEKLATGADLLHTESQSLEAIIHKKFRPALFIIDNRFDSAPDPWAHFNEGSIRQTVEDAIPLIGRVELPSDYGISHGGTGFVVGQGLIMTNRHVAEIFAMGVGTNGLRLKYSMDAGINLRKEVIPTPEVPDLKVLRVLMIHPYWDMALLEVEGLPKDRWLTLSTQHTDDLVGRDIAVVGYPAQDRRNDLDLQKEIFGDVYNVKRMLPGKLDPVRPIDSFGHKVEAATHDASTLGGNSGSAVIDVETGHVIALHFAGLYLDANFAVPTAELARDQRVVDSGVSFGGSVNQDAPWALQWDSADKLTEISTPAPAPAPAPATTTSTTANFVNNTTPTPASFQATTGEPTPAVSVDNGKMSITIPLTITVSLGNATLAQDAKVQTTTPTTPSNVLEFSSREQASIVSLAYDSASSTLLNDSEYVTAAALSAAAASSLVYTNNQNIVEQTCLRQFDFDSCQFFRKNNTECFVASKNNTILVCFRGTQGLDDWIANMNIAEKATQFGMVHSGFLDAFLDISATLESSIDNLLTTEQQLVLTGHSLGGALSTIAASEWRNRYDIRSVYTFGQPAVGNREFRDGMEFMKNLIFRVVNDDDIVPRIPPGYKHVGTRIKLPSNRKLSHIGIETQPMPETLPPENMMTENEFHRLQKHVDSARDSTGIEGILPSFSDHKIINYLNKLLKLSKIA